MAEHVLMLATVVHPRLGTLCEGQTYEIEEGSARVGDLSVEVRLKPNGAEVCLPRADCLIYREGGNAWRRGLPGSLS